jgi:hypothetical protein
MGIQAPVKKNKPDRFQILQAEDGSLPHVNTTVGQQVAAAVYPTSVMKLQNRESTTVEYEGSAQAAAGGYLTYTQLQELAGEYDLDLVRQFEGSVESMQSLMDHTRDLQDAEGYVVRWLDGHMVKIKGEQYCQIHRAKEGILRENGVIGMMLDEKLDDVKGFLFVEDRDALEQFETEFWRGISLKAVAWQAAFDVIKCVYGDDRKGFALVAAQSMEAFQRQAMFKAWDEGDFDWQQAVLDTVRRNISTGVKTDAARHLWGGVRWDGSPMMGSE